MRLFVALEFEELKEYFKEIQNKIVSDNAKITLTRTYHLTLKFLGEVDEKDVELIKDSLKSIKFKIFSTKLDKIGVFPDENCIRVVWIGLKPDDEILELQEKIDNSLSPLFKKEKSFVAHITLGRVKFVKDKKAFVEMLNKIKIAPKDVTIKNFKLVKSTLTKEGSVYGDLEVFYNRNS